MSQVSGIVWTIGLVTIPTVPVIHIYCLMFDVFCTFTESLTHLIIDFSLLLRPHCGPCGNNLLGFKGYISVSPCQFLCNKSKQQSCYAAVSPVPPYHADEEKHARSSILPRLNLSLLHNVIHHRPITAHTVMRLHGQ